MADPPWGYFGDPGKPQAAGKHYDLMTDEALFALPVKDILEPDGVLFLWATCPRLDLAIKCISAWGLHFRGVPFVWCKTTMGGKIISGQGVRPTIVKPTTELVLAATHKRYGRPQKLLDESVGQVVLAPRGSHSEKPAEVYRRIEALYGDVPRIELFSRRVADGWHGWGKESTRQDLDWGMQ